VVVTRRVTWSAGAASAALLPSSVRSFWRQTALLLFVLAFVNGSNYLFHVFISRMLGPSDYGALAALLAMVLILSIPFSVIQTAVANKTAILHSSARPEGVSELAASALKTTTPFAFGAGIVVAASAPLLSVFLRVDIASCLLLAPYVAASIPVSVAQGVLQGGRRFTALAGLQLTMTLARLVLGIAAVWAGFGVAGAVAATAASAFLVLPLALRLVRVGRTAWRRAQHTLAAVRGDLGTALLGLTSFWVLAEVDIPLARHFLDADVAGYYSSAGLVSRALLFLPSAVAIVAFPHFVAARGDDKERMRWLRASVGGVGVLAFVGFLLLSIARVPVMTLAFGERFAPAAGLLPILAVAAAWLAVVNVLVYFHIAMGSRAYLISLGGVALETIGIALFHATAEEVALVTAVVAAAVAFFQYQTAASICRWRPRALAAEHDSPLGGPPDLDLTVVLPCHNASAGLRHVLERLLDQLAQVSAYEVVVVSDGSTDETVAVARSVDSNVVRVIDHPVREGKGHALRLGFREARGRYIAFLDADGDIAPEALQPFLTLMRLYEPDVVIGSKRHPLSEVYYPPLRRLLSWTYHKLVRLLFRVNVRDTQTGFKLIRRDVLAAVLPRLLEKRYAFDLEFLVVARSLGYGRVFEAPVKIEYQFSSQVNPNAAVGIGVDTLAIFYRHYLLNTYCADRPAVASGSALADAPGARARALFVNWRDVKNPEAGGAEAFTHEVARRLAAQGYDVTQLAAGFPGAPRYEVIDAVRVRRLGRLRTGSFHLAVQRELARLRGFDVVVESVNTIPFLTPLWRHRLPPTVTVIHQLAADVWDAELPRLLAPLGRRVEHALLRLYRHAPVAVGSASTRADLERLGFTNLSVLTYGRDEPPDLGDVRKEAKPTFLFVGRLAVNKRPDHAVRAFAAIRHEIPDARLWLVGAGPMEAELAETLPPGAELLGRLPREELYERMARAHCLLVPSVREGWGLVVIEANSVGTPAVGYDIAGVRDSIQPGRTGLLAPAGEPEALGRAAVALVRGHDRYAQTCHEAVEWAANFSWDATATRILEIARSGDPHTSERAEPQIAAPER
jgi:glycosyltransferase involved in cell wall biosynthesis/O-antigen/teichoic acid export membrane protein